MSYHYVTSDTVDVPYRIPGNLYWNLEISDE